MDDSGKDFALPDAKVDRAGSSQLIPASFCFERGHDARNSSNYSATVR